MINSKSKGKNGELEIVNKFKQCGFNARRSQQFCGKGGESADVVGVPFLHIEVKRVEHLNIDEALNQAKRDHKEGTIPAVFHRKNETKWKVTLDFDDFMLLYGEYYSSMILSGRSDEDAGSSGQKEQSKECV